MLFSEERVAGDFKMTLAFLNFVSISIPTVAITESLVASVVFIFSDIFPSHHLWHYKNRNDCFKIGFSCYTLAHKILNLNRTQENHILIEVVRHILSTGVSGERLLHMIRTGKDIVTQVVYRVGTESALTSREVVMVRLSMSILNQLLILTEKKEREVKHSAQMVLAKEVLASTEPEVPDHLKLVGVKVTDKSSLASRHMIQIIAHYVFQPYDSRLAALSVSLLKRLAKHFPKTIMACLGSEAEAVKEHFLSRLDSVTEDIRVKVALLDFLSVCTKYQPALNELFVDTEGNNGQKNDQDDEKTSILETVLNILEEKKSGKYYCPLDLHSAALRFLAQFWIHSQIQVTDSLRKHADFWNLLCYPLISSNGDIETNDPDVSNKLISYILRIVAREISFSKIITGRTDESFNAVLQQLAKKLSAISSGLKKSASVSNIQFLEDGEKVCLVTGWRDLLVSLSTFNPVPIDQKLRYQLYVDLVACLKSQIAHMGSHEVQSALAEACLIVLGRWANDVNYTCCEDEWMTLSCDILYLVNEIKNDLSFYFLITIHSLMTKSILGIKEDQLKKSRLLDWINPASGLLLHSMRILEKMVCDENIIVEQNLSISSLTMFNALFSATSDSSDQWFSSLKSTTVVDTLTEVLKILSEKKKAIDVSQSILHLLISFASHAPTAELVVSHQSLRSIRTSFKVVCNFCLHVPKPEKECPHAIWTNVYILSLRLASTLLMNIKQFFVKDALELVNSNIQRMSECLSQLRNSPSLILLKEAAEVMIMIRTLVSFKEFWISRYPASFSQLMREVSMTCSSVTSFLIRPHMFSYWMQHPTKSSVAIQRSILNQQQSQPNLEKTFSNMPSSDLKQLELTPKINPETEALLIKILGSTISTLSTVTPDIQEGIAVLKTHSRDKPSTMFLNKSFAMPNIDSEKESSFGSILNAIIFCVSELQGKVSFSNVVSMKLIVLNAV